MSNLDEAMNADALEAMKLTRKHFVVELDFSRGSVAELENIADDVDFSLKGGLSSDNVEMLARTWGAYLGETIRRNLGGVWSDDPDRNSICLQFGSRRLDVHEAVRQRLTDPNKPSLEHFYEDIAQSATD